MVEALYERQGEENSGWITLAVIRSAADASGSTRHEARRGDANSPAVTAALRRRAKEANEPRRPGHADLRVRKPPALPQQLHVSRRSTRRRSRRRSTQASSEAARRDRRRRARRRSASPRTCTYVHYAHTSPICTTGGCEKVQHSSYAELAGVPVALLGLIAYVALLAHGGRPRGDGGARGRRSSRSPASPSAATCSGRSSRAIDAICQWCVGERRDRALVVAVLCVLSREPADRARRWCAHEPGAGSFLFAAMCVIWGMPYLMIRVAVRELAPVTLVFGRTAIGALLLAAVRRVAQRPAAAARSAGGRSSPTP